MSIAGGHVNAALAAARVGFRTVQLFTKNNNQWNAPPLDPEGIKAFRDALETNEIVRPTAHDSYLINLASPDDTLWRKSIDALVVEVERCDALGIVDLVVHPGSHIDSGEEAGLIRIARGLDEVHDRTKKSSVFIDLESTAGQGSGLGYRLEHLGSIVDRVKRPDRLGVCLDSCHLFAAGYPLAEVDDYNKMIDDLERSVGLNRVRVWHLNDSLKALGSRVDRHAGIGLGMMGLEPFRNIVNDPRFDSIPLILETPKGVDAKGEDLDAVNFRTLRSLLVDKRKLVS